MKDPTQHLLDLLDREGRSLHALLTRLTLREDVAEDLMQELFIKLARSPSFAASTNANAYVYRAAMNIAFDWRRSHARRPAPVEIPAVGIADHAPSAQSQLIDLEQWQTILTAAENLSELSREVLVLHYLQQETFAAIALRLDKSPHQVRALCHKALEHLRRQLAPTDLPQKERMHASD